MCDGVEPVRRYTGPVCAVCVAGYAMSGRACAKCFDTWVNVLVSVVVLACVLGVLILFVMKKVAKQRPRSAAKGVLRILISFLQMNALLSRYQISGPPNVQSLLDVSDAASGTVVGLFPFQVQSHSACAQRSAQVQAR